MKVHGFHEGDRTEYLALFVFSAVAYCSPVPRQFDRFGVDFFAHLADTSKQNLVASGQAVCAQVKSDNSPVLLDSVELLGCLYDLAVPFFHVVIDKGGHKIQVYTTAGRIGAYYRKWFGRLWVMPGEQGQGGPAEANSSDHVLYLGSPIYEGPLAAFEDDAQKQEVRRHFLSVIRSWAKWEQLLIGIKATTVPFVPTIPAYTTNETLKLDKVSLELYSDPDYLRGYWLAVGAYLSHFRDYLGQLRGGEVESRVPDYTIKATALMAALDEARKAMRDLQPPRNSWEEDR